MDAAGRGDEGIHDVIARRDAGTCTLLADLALKENLGYMCVTENLGLH